MRLPKLGSFVYHYRWPIIVIWALVFLLSLFYFPKVSGVLQPGGFDLPHTEAAKARALLERALL